jgi:long-chain acyl-CoA synthetase
LPRFRKNDFYLYLSNGISIYFAESIEKIGENVKEVKPQYMTVVQDWLKKFTIQFIIKEQLQAG